MLLTVSILTQEKPLTARLAQVVGFAIVARLTLFVARLTLPILCFAKFTKRTFLHAIRKLQEIWRVTAGAPPCLTKTLFTLWKTAFACVFVIIETWFTIGYTPCRQIRTGAFHSGVFAVITVVRPKST